ncbi:MAG: hypothetical protein ACLUGS_10925, partial [Alistipes putredinis]|uniref:hypothetical protein n=1 Tax=Alistipes putredinis TaxID=28117 RepID=UPI003994FBA9
MKKRTTHYFASGLKFGCFQCPTIMCSFRMYQSPGGTPPEDSIANITISSGYRRQHVRFLTTFLPKNYPPSYNFGPRAAVCGGATFGCAFFSLGGST